MISSLRHPRTYRIGCKPRPDHDLALVDLKRGGIEMDGSHPTSRQLDDRDAFCPIHGDYLAGRMLDLMLFRSITCRTSVTELPPTALA